ncbi:MAG: hypothetical protein GY940_11155 [bacterium]|nr:hypothetical protein [bacterium]
MFLGEQDKPRSQPQDRKPAEPGRKYTSLTTARPGLSGTLNAAIAFMKWLTVGDNGSPIEALCQVKEMSLENTQKTINSATQVYTLLTKFAAALPSLFYSGENGKARERNPAQDGKTTAS